MASKPFNTLFRGAGRNALDLPVAGLAGLAAAFAAFVVPQELLSRAVIATGLPSILSAAQPPLGLTARVALAVVGAAIVFGLVFLLLRLLDRSGMSTPEADADQHVAPRVRRRDVHPDAPAPRPISAARDLGEPLPPQAPRATVPLWLDEAEPVAAAEPEAEPLGEYEPAPDPVFAPEPALESVFEPELVSESVFEEPVAEPAFEEEPVAEPDPEPVLVAEPEVLPEVAAEPEIVPEVEPEPDHAPAAQAELPTSIADLMERLEQGLARRRMIEPPAASAPAEVPQVFPEAPEPEAVPDAADDRLQSAIASLQRLAARSS
jgi:hypothetical protein